MVHMNKRLLITGAIGIALIGGAAFAATPRVLNITPQEVAPQQEATAPAAEPEQAAPEATQTAPAGTEQADPTSPASGAQTPDTAPDNESEAPAPVAPVTPPAPKVLAQIQGKNVSTVARPYVNSFTCVYVFTDGSTIERLTPYSADEEGDAAAVCPPSWE